MVTTALTLALSVGLLAEPAAPAAPSFPLDASGTSRDFDRPPPASAADQALWQRTYDTDNDLVLEQHSAAALAGRAKANVERLRDPAARGTLTPDAAEALATPLVAKWTASVDLMSSAWPVSKLRVCRYELMNFDAVLVAGEPSRKAVQLEDARGELNACMAKATRVLGMVRQANRELEAANVAAERALGSASSNQAARLASPAPKP